MILEMWSPCLSINVVTVVIKTSLAVMSLHQHGSLSLLAPEKCLLPLRYVIICHCVLLCICLHAVLVNGSALSYIEHCC